MADKRITNLPFKTDPTLSDEMHIHDVVSNFDKKILISVLRTLLSVPYMQVSLSNYDNDSAPAVKQGSSFDSKGVPTDIASDLTPIGYSGISNSTTFYLYWDESAGSFIYSATIPTWTPLYQGWYNGDDRALFSMYKDSGGTLYRNKVQFKNKDAFPTQGTIGLTNSENVELGRGYWNISLWDTPPSGMTIAIRSRVNGTVRSIYIREEGASDFQSLGGAIFSDGSGGASITSTGTGSYTVYYQRFPF